MKFAQIFRANLFWVIISTKQWNLKLELIVRRNLHTYSIHGVQRIVTTVLCKKISHWSYLDIFVMYKFRLSKIIFEHDILTKISNVRSRNIWAGYIICRQLASLVQMYWSYQVSTSMKFWQCINVKPLKNIPVLVHLY